MKLVMAAVLGWLGAHWQLVVLWWLLLRIGSPLFEIRDEMKKIREELESEEDE